MPPANQYRVVETPSLAWPSDLKLPSRRFRLFVAADTSAYGVEVLSEFGEAALKNGMVYFCAYGPGCERFHDIVDEVILQDDLEDRRFTGTAQSDVIMTTWHDDDSLDEALEFFFQFAKPTEGFYADSEFWVAICVNNQDWSRRIRDWTERAGQPSNSIRPL